MTSSEQAESIRHDVYFYYPVPQALAAGGTALALAIPPGRSHQPAQPIGS